VSDTPQRSYGQILKSSALIGGSSVLSIAFGIVRTKAMALLLGPAGVGLLGLYGSISDLTRSIAGLGINSSGVRQIAEAVGSGDTRRIACTVTTLRRVAFYSGALGALLLLALSKPVSWLTFGDGRHTGAVALLALAVFFGDVSAGQGALIQGMRRIADLARMNVLGALYGTVFGILIVWFYGAAGLVPSLVCVAAMSILTSWWYARRIKVETVRITFQQMTQEASGLLKLGVVFMSSALMTLGAAYLVRIIVLRQISVEAAGFYQAAWALGGLYVGFILQAMGADFYPRLTAAAKDHAECNRLVNEQTEVGLLMAGPGILATLTFAPLVIALFYRPDFAPAAGILRWLCLGMILRVVTWPMGFIIIAKGARKLFFWTEVLANAGYAAFVWVGVKIFGLQGTGIAFFALYLLHFSVVYLVVRRLTAFRWSAPNCQLALLFAPLVAVVFLLPPAAALIVGSAATMASGIYSLRTLCRLLPLERLPQAAQKMVRLLRLTPSNIHPQC
jgi:PST family polysaccharide transporter